ncbi:SIMPL domain-containing protein [Halobaculum sp. EA56]|uniref:SIMPL domain-containing protein n=1 Tax=Halobaculum sp. EA56 TaxID=3421648 RepID=UPI003EB7AE82
MSDQTVAVTGVASEELDPDYATLTVSVSAGGQTASEVHDRASERRAGVVDALASHGISRESITTTEFTVSEATEFLEEPADDVEATVELQFRCTPVELDRLGSVVVDAGGVIQSVELGIDEDRRAEIDSQLLEAAVEHARRRATAIASAHGATLGDVQSFDASTTGTFDSIVDDALAASSGADLSTGPVELSVNVDTVYELQARE